MKPSRLTRSAAFVAALATAAFAGKIVPDGRTVLYDSFDGATVGNAFGPITYEDGLPGLGKAAKLPLGAYLRYDILSWYTGNGPAHPGVEGTVEFWVKLNRDYGEVLQFNWYLTGTPPASGAVYLPYLTADHVYRHWAWPGAWLQPLDGHTIVKADEWTHIATSWGPAGTKIYINGVLDAWKAEGGGWSGVPYLLTNTYIYVNHWGASDLGLIDELHIAKVQLSDEEIAEHATIVFNQAPVANAGPDTVVAGGWPDGAEVMLDGTGSYDPDGDALHYHWSWDSGEATGPTPIVRLPCGTTTIFLVVDDGQLSSPPDFVSVTVLDSAHGHIVDLREEGRLSIALYNPFPVQQILDEAFLTYARAVLDAMRTCTTALLDLHDAELKSSSVAAMAVGWGFPNNFVLGLAIEDSTGTRRALTFEAQCTLPQPPHMGIHRVDFATTFDNGAHHQSAFLHFFAASPPDSSRPTIDVAWLSDTEVTFSISGSILETALMKIGSWLETGALKVADWTLRLARIVQDAIEDSEPPSVVFSPDRPSNWYNVDVKMTLWDASGLVAVLKVDTTLMVRLAPPAQALQPPLPTSEGEHRVSYCLADWKGLLRLLGVLKSPPTLESAIRTILDLILVSSGDGGSHSLPEEVFNTLMEIIQARAFTDHLVMGRKELNIDRTSPNISWTLSPGTVHVTVDDPNHRQNSGLDQVHYWVDGSCIMDENLQGEDTRLRDISVPTSFRLDVSAWDVAGNEARRSMDPYVLSLEPASSCEVQFAAAEHYLWFNNNGLKEVELQLNDARFRLVAHATRRDQEGDIYFVPEYGGASVDFSPYIGDRKQVHMLIHPFGPSGACGFFIFSDCNSVTAVRGGSSPSAMMPRAFSLEQCSPNPFQTRTVIRYQVPSATELRLRVFDLLGREVRQLVGGQQPAGYYFAHWDGRTSGGDMAASGTYLVRLDAPGYHQTRKVLLLR
ncbi:MAG: T9SS type A sorting domain-containing protein [Calditrichaeota bacterium]|nr:T9SS type A sorting domain-containing protein [Calditrichota bacterium]